jgi:prepilin-type N-terminal cleavage/methylation domain-containing protein
MYIDNKYCMKQGFSMLEILIVMSIIGMLIAIGVAGMTELRTNMEAQQAINELTANLKDTQNKAKNNEVSVSNANDLENLKSHIFGYQLYTATDPVSNSQGLFRRLCMKDITNTGPWNVTDCSGAGLLLKSASFTNVDITNTIPYSGSPNVPVCTGNGVFFENLTGKIFEFNNAGEAISNASGCAINIFVKSSNFNYAWIIFESTNGSYYLQKL